jgi:NADPH-dependent ferric siderophore reductase
MASVKKLVGEVFGKWLFREVTIAEIREVAPRFRRLSLEGQQLHGVSFSPGDKVQVLLDAGFRTYTPFGFDPARGAMSFLVYLHGDTPGSQWGKSAKEGDAFRVFGPRASLPFMSWQGPVVVFGDETSFAVTRSLRELRGSAREIHPVFEVSDAKASAAALDSLELPSEDLVQRQSDDGHLDEVAERVRAALAKHPGSQLALTGKAQSIQALQRALRAAPVAHAGSKSKAYWAPGKRGLD